MPNGFPHHGVQREKGPSYTRWSGGKVFQRLDLVGAILLLIATLFLVAALEEADVNYPWKSAFVITLLTISGLCWIAFLIWSRRITLRERSLREPVLPWRFVQNRVMVGMLLYVHRGNISFFFSLFSVSEDRTGVAHVLISNLCRSAIFLGGPWFCAIFQLPQRYQIVNSLEPLEAGIRLIPFTLAAPFGSIVSAGLAKGARIPPLYFVILAASLQVIGFALLSTVPESHQISAAQYGYEIIAGFGCGINISLLLVMVPFRVQERDKGKWILVVVLDHFAKPLASGRDGLNRSVPRDGWCDWPCYYYNCLQRPCQGATQRFDLWTRARNASQVAWNDLFVYPRYPRDHSNDVRRWIHAPSQDLGWSGGRTNSSRPFDVGKGTNYGVINSQVHVMKTCAACL